MKELSKEQLIAENKALRAELAKRDEEIALLRQETKLLRQKMDLLIRRMFGRSSEKMSADQLDLFLLGGDEPGKGDASLLLEEAEIPTTRGERRPKVRRERVPSDLPVVEEIIEPAEVQAAPADWRLIGVEVNEQLDYEPARFLMRRLVRRKYVHRADRDVPPVIAPLPEMLQERCIAAPGLLAAVIVGKYCDHLPLYRQEAIFASRHGVELPRASLARWIGLCAEWLRPIYENIRTGVMGGGYVQVDETPIRYLAPGHGQTKLGYLWTAHAPGGDTFYHWETSRGAHCLKNVIAADFRGKIQCDAYAAYPSFAREKDDIELVGCWAHARRAFYEAREQVPVRAAWVLCQIGLLYQIEARLREASAGPQLRAARRASQSMPILRRIHRALTRFKASARHLPKSHFGKAIDYTLSHWNLLLAYVEDGRLEIDNNLVENAIRPTAIGKKNWLFIGDAESGDRSAILFTLVECCRRRGINPFEYLRDVLTRLPSATNWNLHQLTPDNWQKQRSSPSRAA